jgi:hypothetical protein
MSRETESEDRNASRHAVPRIVASSLSASGSMPTPGVIRTFIWPLGQDVVAEVRFGGITKLLPSYFEDLCEYLQLVKRKLERELQKREEE